MTGRPTQAKPKAKPIGGGARQFRRLEARARTTAPLPLAWATGLALGALGGLGFAAWEAAILRGAGLAYAPDRAAVAGGCAAVGAVLGLAAGSTGLWSVRWSSATALLALGWLGSAQVAGSLADAGVPGALGTGVVMVAAFALSQLLGRAPGPAWVHQAFASFVVAALAALGPLHAHLLSQGTSGGALAVSGLVLLGAGALAALSAASSRDGPPLLSLVAFVALGAALFAAADRRPARAWTATAQGPPVVLIVVSGLRADRAGFGGYTRPTTPSLDAFAGRAVVYGRAHATSNWTVPSLASMLTGRLPYEHGAGLNGGWGAVGSPLRPDVRTVAQALAGEGYATAAVVADPRLRTFSLDAGFQVWQDDPPGGARPALLLPLVAAGVDPPPWPRRSEADRVTARALDLVASAPDRGWFLLVQYGDVAGPFSPTPDDERAMGFTARPWPNDLYDAGLRRIDREVARLLDALPAEAWVVVVGDRGAWLGEERPAHAAGRPRARYGATMFEEMLHVPLVVRGPGARPGRAEEPVSVVDLAPTLLRAAGLPLPADGDGHALGRPFGEAEESERVTVAQSSLFGVEQQAVIVGRHKIVQTSDGRTPLFDLEADPAEASPMPKDAGLDNLQRKLLALLPPAGSGHELRDPPRLVLQVGQVASRFATGASP